MTSQFVKIATIVLYGDNDSDDDLHFWYGCQVVLLKGCRVCCLCSRDAECVVCVVSIHIFCGIGKTRTLTVWRIRKKVRRIRKKG
jgi:hypothetical protein